ncbi:MAG TPA: DUF3575 domain-containing protein [Cyclobacteriaceae bacterium]|nr:DUF3575 domain-containing protein [Cyclobacteriaceae bacterium]HPW64364.1 DUF3575 domain-containing protein [Cyclobacteriaceae bacterium]
MKNIAKQLFCVSILFLAVWMPAQAQKGDTTLRKNVIKLDITSYWLYRNAVVFAYERVTKNKPYQTWGVIAGYQQFPTVFGKIDNTNVNVTGETQASGIKIGGEYRFYLQKENKYRAPHGVYLGPYTTFHNYSNGRSLEIDNNGVLEYADLKSDLNILNIGVQLGYQFILNNRWAIDLVFIGPSVSNYSFKTSMDGTYTFDPDEITNEVVLDLMERFPAFKELVNEGEFASKGKVSTWAYGYRYQFQIGYHFGRKKK